MCFFLSYKWVFRQMEIQQSGIWANGTSGKWKSSEWEPNKLVIGQVDLVKWDSAFFWEPNFIYIAQFKWLNGHFWRMFNSKQCIYAFNYFFLCLNGQTPSWIGPYCTYYCIHYLEFDVSLHHNIYVPHRLQVIIL